MTESLRPKTIEDYAFVLTKFDEFMRKEYAYHEGKVMRDSSAEVNMWADGAMNGIRSIAAFLYGVTDGTYCGWINDHD